MKQLLFILLIVFLSACGKMGETLYYSQVKFEVQDTNDTKVSYRINEDNSISFLKWEEGDEVSFIMSIPDPEVKNHSFYFDEEILFQASGKLVYTQSGWKTYVKTDTGFIQQETVEIISTKKDATLHIHFDYTHKVPSEEWFTVGYYRAFPFQEGGQMIVLDLSEMFASASR